MSTITLVAGTFTDAWCHDDSLFRRYLADHELDCRWFRGWSGNVSGVPNILAKSKNSDWEAGGYALADHLDSLEPASRIVIAHSHGGQVAAYGAALAGIYIHRLLTVCTPVRGDMRETWVEAHRNIGAHRHISAEGWDFWQRLGEWGDGVFGWTRTIDGAENLLLEGIGHAGLLSDARFFHYLTEPACGKVPTLDFLREPGIVTVQPEPSPVYDDAAFPNWRR